MTRRWGLREKRNRQARKRRNIKGSMVCDVGRVLVIAGSLIRFFRCVRA